MNLLKLFLHISCIAKDLLSSTLTVEPPQAAMMTETINDFVYREAGCLDRTPTWTNKINSMKSMTTTGQYCELDPILMSANLQKTITGREIYYDFILAKDSNCNKRVILRA